MNDLSAIAVVRSILEFMASLFATMASEYTESDEKGKLLLTAYRLAYEFIGNASKEGQLKQEWLNLVESHKGRRLKDRKAAGDCQGTA